MSGKQHLKRIHACPCVYCTFNGLGQTSRTIAHHLESIRDENSDYAAVPLCDECHKYLHSVSRRGFEMRTKLTELDLLCLTIKQLEKEGLLI